MPLDGTHALFLQKINPCPAELGFIFFFETLSKASDQKPHCFTFLLDIHAYTWNAATFETVAFCMILTCNSKHFHSI